MFSIENMVELNGDLFLYLVKHGGGKNAGLQCC